MPKQEPDIPVTPSSGNVFADLGFAEPEEELTKAQLASRIRQISGLMSPEVDARAEFREHVREKHG